MGGQENGKLREQETGEWEDRETERTGDGRRETGDGRRETGDGRRETGDGRRETGDGRRETGDGRRETGDGRREDMGHKHREQTDLMYYKSTNHLQTLDTTLTSTTSSRDHLTLSFIASNVGVTRDSTKIASVSSLLLHIVSPINCQATLGVVLNAGPTGTGDIDGEADSIPKEIVPECLFDIAHSIVQCKADCPAQAGKSWKLVPQDQMFHPYILSLLNYWDEAEARELKKSAKRSFFATCAEGRTDSLKATWLSLTSLKALFGNSRGFVTCFRAPTELPLPIRAAHYAGFSLLQLFRKLKTGEWENRKLGTGNRENGKWENMRWEDGRRETGFDGRMENGKQEMGNGKRETGNRKQETGNGKREMGNGRWETGVGSRE
ncbi:hypothetical protein C8R48DRAFT_676408 [Suillus tomentosus]|nr:hypothetical protein C8R48DRAFT_676408 [Suillus tomentosus]